MSFNYERERERIQKQLAQTQNAVQERDGESLRQEREELLAEAYKIAQEAGMEEMLASAKSSPWKLGKITPGQEDDRKYLSLSYEYEVPSVEEGIVGSRLRFGQYVTRGIQHGNQLHLRHKTGLYREPKRAVTSWTTEGASTSLEVGAVLIDGKPHVYVYDSTEDLRDAFHDTHPGETPRYESKNYLHTETDSKHYGQALEVTSTSDVSLVQTFLRDHILASCLRRQHDAKLPTDLTLISQARIATLPPTKRH